MSKLPEVKHTQQTLYKIEMVLESISNGVTVLTACKKANLNRQVFYVWISASKDNEDRYYNARNQCTAAVEDALYKKAIEGDNTAMIFWLTNRSKDKWLHRQVQEIHAQVNHKAILEELESSNERIIDVSVSEPSGEGS